MSQIDFKNVCKKFGPTLPWTINSANLTIGRGGVGPNFLQTFLKSICDMGVGLAK